MSEGDYAGDITPKQAFELLSEDPRATLVDVRTDAEWNNIGVPDLSGLGKRPLLVQWQTAPTMQVNPGFEDQVSEQAAGHDAPILFLCRSGARSRSAAIAMTAMGFGRCYNVSDGFEGPPDGAGYRGTLAGWKADGLPWRQG